MKAARVILLGVLVLAAGCGPKAPPTRIYRLTLPPLAGSEGAPMAEPPGDLGRVELGIPAFRVDPPYDEDRIVFRAGAEGLEVGFLGGMRWAVPLSEILPIMLAEHLTRVTGSFVTAGPPRGRPLDAVLDGRVMSLERIDLAEGSIASFRMELTLRRRDGSSAWTAVAEGQAPMPETEGVGAVRSLQTAVIDALDRSGPALAGALIGLARAEQREASPQDS